MSSQTTTPERPVLIKVHPDDNVAIVVNSGGLPAGARFDDGLILRERVPQGHKVALADIAEGAGVRRYGEVIGYATRPLVGGCWVDERAVRLPPAPALDSLPLATRVPPASPPLEGYTFDGYRNPDGSVGTRNILGISTSVNCVAGVVDHVVRLVQERLLPRYPNVDAVVGLNHVYGCGVGIEAPDAAVPIRALQNLALNPNFGGQIMIVSLGCEKLQPERLLPAAALVGGNVDETIVRLQDDRFRGFEAMVEAILAMAERRLAVLDRRRRETCPASDLVVGVQCGGSDAFSGVTANPAVGFCSDLLVRAGATVMFSEVTEVRDAVQLLTARCATPEIGRAMVREMDWYDRYLAAGGIDRSANPTPGNREGGLVNIVEKTLGCIAKSGTSAISDVLSHGERVRRKGLVFAATPSGDFVCGTMQLAAGMTLHVFTTGRGTPYGLAAAPVIKMATRKDLSARWHDLIDIDAGRIATGERTIEEVGWELFRLVLDVASGRTKPWAERWGLDNGLAIFNPAPLT
jgi:galactarate dehydratase